MENVQRSDRLVTCDNFVDDAARNAPHFAGADPASFFADRELGRPGQHQTYLLVRMAMRLDDRVWLHFHQREHQLLAARRVDVHPGKDAMVSAFLLVD